MVPDNIRQHNSLKILFIGNTREPFYSAHYYKAFQRMGHQVVSVAADGDIKVDGPFTYKSMIKPALNNLNFKPDLIVLVECYPLFGDFNTSNLCNEAPAPTALISIDSGLNHVQHSRIGNNFDFVFISDQDYLDYYANHCQADVSWLQFGCDPEIHKPLKSSEDLDLAFAGRAFKYPDFYKDRIAYLKALESVCRFKNGEALSYEATARLYARSRMIFNYALVNGVNARIYEALSFGKLLLTNRTNALRGVFADKVHLVFYDNLPHLVSLIKFYRSNPEKRNKIAFQGQYKAWRHHTFYHRVDKLMRRIFQEYLYKA